MGRKQTRHTIGLRPHLFDELEHQGVDNKSELIEDLINLGIDLVERGAATAQDLAAAVPVPAEMYGHFQWHASLSSSPMPELFEAALVRALDAAGAP